MAANRLTQTVREQLGAGRVLPLGGPADGSWITERAAVGALRAAVGAPAGARIGRLRLSVADPGHAPEPVVPPPPSALPPGPLRIDAAIDVPVVMGAPAAATVPDRPLPEVADQVRAALLEASVRDLGLVVSVVDLLVSGLVEAPGEAVTPPGAAPVSPPPVPPGEAAATPPGTAGAGGPEGIAAVAREVPGVARLTPVLGGLSRPVRPAGGHALIQLAVAAGYRALDVSSAVRHAVAAAPSAPSTIAVLVTAVEQQ
ncbi:hypothetical protein [Streptomyces sp. NBRC 110611]|uniref:hypothetical protein n=1 Tax=Streptomyces sp. NBRC 110611 TaxID=1621259 RepID=UPI000832DC3D|nr:hypothetical protein [Streptomyces sp. NBRC 110611]